MKLDFTIEDIAALAFIAFSMFMLLRTVWNVLSAFESKTWPEASGVILSSRVDESNDSEGGTLFKAAVSYRFQVLDQELTGQRACFGDSSATNIPALARRIAKKYRAGQAVTVRYNPAKPQECVLETGLNAQLVVDFAFGCLFLVIGIITWRSNA
jgi:uncharacterized protein DUF3592